MRTVEMLRGHANFTVSMTVSANSIDRLTENILFLVGIGAARVKVGYDSDLIGDMDFARQILKNSLAFYQYIANHCTIEERENILSRVYILDFCIEKCIDNGIDGVAVDPIGDVYLCNSIPFGKFRLGNVMTDGEDVFANHLALVRKKYDSICTEYEDLYVPLCHVIDGDGRIPADKIRYFQYLSKIRSILSSRVGFDVNYFGRR